MPANSKKWKFLHIFSILTIFTMVITACKPAPSGIPPESPQYTAPGNVGETPGISKSTQELGLQVVDDGSPLPPALVSQQPQDGAEFPGDGKIILVFDQPMNPDTTGSAWTLIAPDGSSVAGEIHWPERNTMEFTPTDELSGGSTFRGVLTTEASGSTGITLENPINFQFSTIGPLQVSQVYPADGTNDVASNGIITVIFNRPVVPLVVAEEQSKLPEPLEINPKISGRGEWVSTSVYAFRPDRGLTGATTYSVSVKSDLQDATGESKLEMPYSWSFTTSMPAIDSFELSSGQVNPPDNYDNVLLDVSFKIHFLQSMVRSSVESALSVKVDGGTTVGLTPAWSEDSTTIVITPTQLLKLGTNYNLVLDSQAKASNGGTLKEGLNWNFKTIPSPAIVSTQPGNNSQQDPFSGQVFIKFASPMRINTVKERIKITPVPEGNVEWWYNEWDWSMSGYFLKPSTRYEILFMPGMQDIYGNSTQTEKVVRFTTGKRQPFASLALPYDVPVFRANGPAESQQFYATYTNVDLVSFKLATLTPMQMVGFLGGYLNAYQYEPEAGTVVWQKTERSGGKLNEQVLKSFQLETKNGASLLPGFYFLGMDSPSVDHGESSFADYRLIVVASANLTFKSSSTDALVWLTDLETGRSVPDTRVTIYDRNYNAIGNGTTVKDGTLHLELPAPNDPYDPRFAISEDGKTFGFASSQWGSGVSLYDYGIWSSYYAPADQPTVYLYTERPLYRPGQPVYFKGIVRVDDDLKYKLPEVDKVRVKINSFKDNVYDEELALSTFGSFDGKFTLDTEAALGYYTIEVSFPGIEQTIGSLTFNVAEYRKPEFQVSVVATPKDVLQGENFTASVQADYYSGGGVSDATVDWTLISEPFYFTPPDDYSSYSFQDFDEDTHNGENESENGSQQVAQGSGKTDPLGKFSQTLPADLSEFKTSRQFTFEATVTDIAQTSVSGRTMVIAHLSAVYPGIKPKTYIGREGEEQIFQIVALNWDGTPIPQQSLSVEIVERRWYSVQEQDATGRVKWITSVEEIPVGSYEDLVTDENGQAEINFVPPNGGIFKAKVTALDSSGNAGSASAYQWIAARDFIPWQQTNDRSFDLITDKKKYSPGDKAQVLIASPFQGEASALVTVERGQVHYQDVIELTSNSQVYNLEITPDLAPNAYISVLIVKGVDENNPRPNFKLGISEIQVDTSQQQIRVEVIPDQKIVEPGEQVGFTVRTHDFQGEAIPAEVSLSLSDLATLSLLPPNSEPILDYFYSERSLGVWTSVPLSLNVDDYNAEIQENLPSGESQGSGGGKGEGDLGVVLVRQDFPDTAFWNAHVLTDNNGEAKVKVNLPDNLTTWRMDARAVTQDTLVGQSMVDIVSTKPLLVRPQTPRFFVAGDHVRLGTAVNNNTDQSLSTIVSLQATGVTLRDPVSQTVQVAPHSQEYVTWDSLVETNAQRVDLIFRANGGMYSDASRPPQGKLDNQGIPVYQFEARETVGTSGQMTNEGVKIEAIVLPKSMSVTSGDLKIAISPSLAAGMTDGLTYLEKFPYECVEQTISRFLPNVITTRALKTAGITDPNLEQKLNEEVGSALQRLYTWQNPDGGWGWWSSEKSDPLTTAYVVLGFIEAKSSGYTVDSTVNDRALYYLRTQIISIAGLKDPQILNRQAFLLYVLARAGKPDVSSTVQLYDQHQRMALYAQAFLSQALYTIDENDPRLDTLLSVFASSAILSASGSHWEEKVIDEVNWNTDTRTTAIILSTLSLLDPESALNVNAVRWLMSNRSDGHWRGTQETAWTLMALTNWMMASGELNANYQFAVALNGERLGGGTATSENLRQSLELQVDISKLLKDKANRLAIARDVGQGNLYYTAYLNAYLPVNQVQPIDRGVVVSRSYYQLDDLERPVTAAKIGDLLLVRVTIVTPNTLHYLVVNDPLPAGLEAVDQSLTTSPQSVEVPQEMSWNDVFQRGWGWWYFSNIQRMDEKVVLSANQLPGGTYIYTYLARASTAGEFQVIPTTAQEFYFPEVYGRGAGMNFAVNP